MGLVGLFNKRVLDFGPDFPICPMMGARCVLLEASCIGGIPFDDYFGMCWVGLELRVRGALRPA